MNARDWPDWLAPAPRRAALIAFWSVLAFALPRGAGQENPKAKTFHEYRPVLKSAADDPNGLELTGPDADKCVLFEPGGVRIALPTGFGGTRPDTGVIVPVTVTGDFELTVAFEVLKAPSRDEAGEPQTRLTLDVAVDRKRLFPQATISGRMSKWLDTREFFAWVRARGADGRGEPKYKADHAHAQSGRLRLIRAGNLVSYFGADGADEWFMPIEQFPLSAKPADSAEPLNDVRITASTGGPKAALEARITSIVVRGDALSKVSEVIVRAEAPSRSWIIVVVAILVLLLLAALLALALFMRSRRAPAPP
jgi:hypothetical protein